jgi:hypothetical protein
MESGAQDKRLGAKSGDFRFFTMSCTVPRTIDAVPSESETAQNSAKNDGTVGHSGDEFGKPYPLPKENCQIPRVTPA